MSRRAADVALGHLWPRNRPATPLEPALVALPFRPLGDSEESRDLAAGITLELTDSLRRYQDFRLYAGPIGLDLSGRTPSEVGQYLGVGFVVSGIVRSDADSVHFATQLVEIATGRVVWTNAYDRAARLPELIAMQQAVATEIGHPTARYR
ncbi:hypothetical protein ACW9UR_05505 [Halovulum sp. GXIMD14794]